jgi:hypothetical protein
MTDRSFERKDYIGYDYKEAVVDNSSVSEYMDGYECFGWTVEDSRPGIQGSGKTIIRLKRNRKIINKTELIRLEKYYEDCMRQIAVLEQSRHMIATMIALMIGIFGCAFMAGSVFAVTHEPPMIALCVILAIPGFAGWIMPYFIYRYIEKKKTEQVAPLIEAKRDEVYAICEKGHKLLSD